MALDNIYHKRSKNAVWGFILDYSFIAVKGLLYLSDNSLITSFSGLLSLSLSTMDGIAALAELYKVTISLGCKIN